MAGGGEGGGGERGREGGGGEGGRGRDLEDSGGEEHETSQQVVRRVVKCSVRASGWEVAIIYCTPR